ncbi:MAG TPA: extracellular solute-binding protein, partial [Anaerolineae bacterium]|nr:extracellular solute-binding protein [Anaerolineae bacterium]
VDQEGNITINNPQAITAIARAGSWIGTISPPRVIFYLEEDARRIFQLGNAVFMRNWPYAWALLNSQDSAVAGKVGVAPLPQGGPRGHHAATLGGWQLAVNKHSNNPEAAADLVRFLSSKKVQKHRAIAGAFAPTIMDLYDDPEVLDANPFFAELRPVLEHAVARPTRQTGEKYMAVSSYFWDAVHDVLQGIQPAASSLAALEDQLRLIKVREGGKVW